MSPRRHGTALSLKQIAAMAGSLVAVYYVAANHAALRAWFAAGSKTRDTQ